MNKTIEDFLKEVKESSSLKEKMISNFKNQERKEIILNLFDLDFNFEKLQVTIFYYLLDNNYPPVTLTNKEFIELLQNS